VLQRLAVMDLDPRQLPPDGSSGFIAAITNPCEKALSRTSADNAHQRPGLRSRCCGRSATFRPAAGQAAISICWRQQMLCISLESGPKSIVLANADPDELGAISQQCSSMREGV
jgi:hypothetical protein